MATAAEFDRQLERLAVVGYPRLAGLSEAEFAEQLAPLRERVPEGRTGSYPFVIVVGGELAHPDDAIHLVERDGERADLSMLGTGGLAGFTPTDAVELPDGAAYLAVGLDTGTDSMNIPPEQALPMIEAAGRSPLTVEEGIAFVTQFPEAVAPNAGFSLAGSRAGDRRVTAFWISKKRPKLGWCWAGAPHTWLGTASCASRAGA